MEEVESATITKDSNCIPPIVLVFPYFCEITLSSCEVLGLTRVPASLNWKLLTVPAKKMHVPNTPQPIVAVKDRVPSSSI